MERQSEPLSSLLPMTPSHMSRSSGSSGQLFNCPYCFDKGFIEFIDYPDGRQVQLPPSQPSGLAMHQIVREWAIEHGANPNSPWERSRDAKPWPPCPVRISVETCDCSRTDAIKSRLRRLLDSGEVPPMHHAHSFDTWKQLPEAKRQGKSDMLAVCEEFAAYDGPREPGEKFGLVLSGPVGIGKTGLASCVLMERARRGQAVLWIDFNNLVNRARASNRPGAETTYEDIIGAAASVPFLLIDDFGDMARKADISDFVREVVYDIIRQRFDFLRDTLITTNLTAEQFKEMFGDRINRRVNGEDGMCHWEEVQP